MQRQRANLTLDQVVRQIVDGAQVRACGYRGAFGDDAAVESGPLHGVIMRVHVGSARLVGRIKRHLSVTQDLLQDREAEATRTGMDQDIGMVAVEPRLRGDLRHQDFLDRLDLAEVVAAADAAERGIEGGRAETGVGQSAASVAIPGLIERVQPLGQPQLARGDIKLKQPMPQPISEPTSCG
jgi:hypothetical protein